MLVLVRLGLGQLLMQLPTFIDAPPPYYHINEPPSQILPQPAPPSITIPPVQIENPPAPTIQPVARPATPFEVVIHVIQPAKRPRPTSRKTKADKTEPVSVGPANLTADITWDVIISTLADILKCQTAGLHIGTFEWRWLKPANSAWLPLQNDTGLSSMLNKIVAAKTSPYIIVRMQPPQAPLQVQSLPWVTPSGSSNVDEGHSSDDDGRPMLKKVESFFLGWV